MKNVNIGNNKSGLKNVLTNTFNLRGGAIFDFNYESIHMPTDDWESMS